MTLQAISHNAWTSFLYQRWCIINGSRLGFSCSINTRISQDSVCAAVRWYCEIFKMFFFCFAKYNVANVFQSLRAAAKLLFISYNKLCRECHCSKYSSNRKTSKILATCSYMQHRNLSNIYKSLLGNSFRIRKTRYCSFV